MRLKILSVSAGLLIIFITQSVIAAPSGGILFHNTSGKTISAQVSTFSKFNLKTNERKHVTYRLLEQACSPNPTKCIAHFYINNKPAGTATINAVTGHLMQLKLMMKVHIAKTQHVVRSVIIQ